MSGTSQATPFVTAAAALLLGSCRQQEKRCSVLHTPLYLDGRHMHSCTALEIKAALLEGAQRSEALEGRLLTSGFLDIPNAARILGLSNSSGTFRNEADICSGATSHPLSFVLMSMASIIFLLFVIP